MLNILLAVMLFCPLNYVFAIESNPFNLTTSSIDRLNKYCASDKISKDEYEKLNTLKKDPQELYKWLKEKILEATLEPVVIFDDFDSSPPTPRVYFRIHLPWPFYYKTLVGTIEFEIPFYLSTGLNSSNAGKIFPFYLISSKHKDSVSAPAWIMKSLGIYAKNLTFCGQEEVKLDRSKNRSEISGDDRKFLNLDLSKNEDHNFITYNENNVFLALISNKFSEKIKFDSKNKKVIINGVEKELQEIQQNDLNQYLGEHQGFGVAFNRDASTGKEYHHSRKLQEKFIDLYMCRFYKINEIIQKNPKISNEEKTLSRKLTVENFPRYFRECRAGMSSNEFCQQVTTLIEGLSERLKLVEDFNYDLIQSVKEVIKHVNAVPLRPARDDILDLIKGFRELNKLPPIKETDTCRISDY